MTDPHRATTLPDVPPVLSVRNLRTWFHGGDAPARAVDGVSFDVLRRRDCRHRRRESGCGKSVTALSVLRLIRPPGRIEHGSQIVFEGRDLLGM